MKGALIAAAFVVGCAASPARLEHPCKECKYATQQERHGPHDMAREKHRCECAGCGDCKAGRPCGNCEM